MKIRRLTMVISAAFAVFSLGLLLASPASADPPAPLEVALSVGSAGDELVANTPIDLSVTLTNISEETVTIIHPDYWGASTIRVENTETDAEVEALSVKAERKKLDSNWLVLEPGESAEHTFVGMRHWTCCFMARWPGFEPGTYTISLTITSPPVKVTPPTDHTISWTGELKAQIDVIVHP